MNLYNIRIIISGRNEYRGSIIIDEKQSDIWCLYRKKL